MPGLLAKKLEMTRIIKDHKFIPVTLLQVPSLKIVSKKTQEKDNYNSICIWILDEKINDEDKMTIKEWKNSINSSLFTCIREFELNEEEIEKYNVWDEISLDMLEWVEEVSLEWYSKWKWFAWAMKRWNFSWWPWRVWSKFHRALWSIWTRKPRRTHKGKKMHWHLWNEKVTIKKTPLELVDKELRVIAVRWWVPGWRNSLVKITLN